ncbi:hypothetical protein CCACVL1_07672 [Corchorus capsularis]|uniref:Embryo sac development arrest 6 n=1 Tax=Corchorus capsularis TaxID=210143 RepID=A0A1R3J4L5_COCAP|nr:hypothetical protein CCACVL1_07672 [Corchorus capsularis]
MNTKTMRLPPRRVSNSIPNNNKRKERDDFDLKHLTPPPTKWLKPAVPLAGSGKAAQPVLSNQLLAGYLAHEFLTRGTLFGQTWDPTRAQPAAAESRKEEIKEEAEASERSKAGEPEPEPEPEPKPKPKLKLREREEKHLRYAEVASLLKTDGAHIPGIVNPSQLARYLQM